MLDDVHAAFGSSAFNIKSSTQASGWTCKTPVKFLVQSEAFLRPCGHCKRCLAVAKRDRTARAVAEAVGSAEVYVFLLTYRPDEMGARKFVADDRARFFKRLRQQVWRDTLKALGFRERQRLTAEQKAMVADRLPEIFYFGVGETGKHGKQQKHWHVILFASKPLGLRCSGIGADGKLERMVDAAIWPHGWYSCELKDRTPSRLVSAIRYCTKYVDKCRGISRSRRLEGVRPDVVFFSSSRRPLGAELVIQRARDCAAAGLAFDGTYYVPGVVFSRARKLPNRDRVGRAVASGAFVRTGSADVDRAIRAEWQDQAAAGYQRNHVLGVLRRQAADAFVEAWRARRPGAPIPASEFVKRWSSIACQDEFRQTKPHPGWDRVSPRVSVMAGAKLPPYRDPRRVGLLMVQKEGRTIGSVSVSDTGAALFIDTASGDRCFLPRGDLQLELPQLGQRDREVVERWLFERRGVGWLDHLEWHAAARQVVMRRDAALRRSFKAGPNLNPAYMQPDESDTALRRKLRMAGDGHVEAAVAALRGGGSPALVKPVAKRVA